MPVGLSQNNIDAASLAGGVIAVEILQTLFDKEILSLADCRGILQRAMDALAPVARTSQGHGAQLIIAALQSREFTERR